MAFTVSPEASAPHLSKASLVTVASSESLVHHSLLLSIQATEVLFHDASPPELSGELSGAQDVFRVQFDL